MPAVSAGWLLGIILLSNMSSFSLSLGDDSKETKILCQRAIKSLTTKNRRQSFRLQIFKKGG